MTPAVPAHTEISVRLSDAGLTVPALATQPVLSAASLKIRGFVFEQQRFAAGDVAAGRLLNPLVLFPLSDGMSVEWNRGERVDKAVTHAGAFFTFPSGEELRGLWAGELDALVLSIDPRECQVQVPRHGSVNLRAETNVQDAQLWHLALALKADAEAGSPAGRRYGEAVASAIAVYAFSRYSGPPQGFNSLPLHIQAAVQYIGENIHEDLRLDTLARVAQMTPDAFRRFFRACIGLPPHQFVLQERIRRARELLFNRSLSIAQVAHAVGFPNQAHFDTVFRRFESITPKLYRDRNRKS